MKTIAKFLSIAALAILSTSCTYEDTTVINQCETAHIIECDTQDNLIFIDGVIYNQQYNFDGTWRHFIGFWRTGANEFKIVSTKNIKSIQLIDFNVPNVRINYVDAHTVIITADNMQEYHFDHTDYLTAQILVY
jgi:hypothetical protein